MTSASLGSRAARINLLMAGAALAVAGVLLILFQYSALRGALLDDLQVQARIVGNNSSAALLFGDRRAGAETLAALAMSPPVQSAVIAGPDGKLLAAYQRNGAPLPALPNRLVTAQHVYQARSIDVLEPLYANGAAIGSVAIHASLTPLYSRLGAFAGFTATVALASLLLARLLVSQLRRAMNLAERELHQLAHIDPVTTLPNRNAFNQRLDAILQLADRQQREVSLLLLDLDNFKVVNDTLGHNCGDMLLLQVAVRLRDALSARHLLCRIGGDEFAVVIEDGAAAGEAAAQLVLATLALPFQVEHQALHMGASIGASRYPRDAASAQSLMRCADTAMYHAKSGGKNALRLFDPAMEQRARQRMKLETNLRQALARDQLTLHYQPQIDARTGRISGFEVLTRWTCPELGHVSPAEFIPVAEESGIIVALGRWVLLTACQQAGAWYRAGLLDGISRVAVNLSARQTSDPALLDDIMALLAQSGLPPALLELEITEGVLMDNVHANLELMHRIEAAGIQLSIDDFGTGYSSMAYLQRFPIDQLKIDRSFVSALATDGAPIATAIIAMAHSLSLSVVAEGVETAQQSDFLRQAGCDSMQGYYFDRPMPAGQLEVLLRERRRYFD